MEISVIFFIWGVLIILAAAFWMMASRRDEPRSRTLATLRVRTNESRRRAAPKESEEQGTDNLPELLLALLVIALLFSLVVRYA